MTDEISEVQDRLFAFVTSLARLVTGDQELAVRLDIRAQRDPHGHLEHRLYVTVNPEAARILIGAHGSAASALRTLIKGHALAVLHYRGDLDVRIVKPAYAEIAPRARNG